MLARLAASRSKVSDDSFAYLRNWVLAQGPDAFEQAMFDPDSIAGPASDDEAISRESAPGSRGAPVTQAPFAAIVRPPAGAVR